MRLVLIRYRISGFFSSLLGVTQSVGDLSALPAAFRIDIDHMEFGDLYLYDLTSGKTHGVPIEIEAG